MIFVWESQIFPTRRDFELDITKSFLALSVGIVKPSIVVVEAILGFTVVL